MLDQNEIIQAIARTAEAWQDPDHEPRARAVEETLAGSGTHTEEGLAYAINVRMHQLSESRLREWTAGRRAPISRRVGVLNTDAEPLAELADFLAVLLTGHPYVGVMPPASPLLLPAFAAELQSRLPELPVEFVDRETLWSQSEAVIVRRRLEDDDEDEAVDTGAEGMPVLATVQGIGLAVIDGRETAEEREALAEDCLLYDGRGTRSVRVVWAPKGLSPDPYLDAMADFRGVFPSAPGLAGTLKMQKALLDAHRLPNAFGEGLEFLLSKGDPEPQRPGHVRWVEYTQIEEVRAWMAEHRPEPGFIGARPAVVKSLLDLGTPASELGEANRPPLGWSPGGVDVLDFLCRLS